MDIIKAYDNELVSFGLAFITSLVLWALQGKVKLRWGMSHGFSYQVKSAESSFLVHTKTYLVSNLGRKPASGIELTFGFRPDNFSLWPQRNYVEALNKDGCLTLKFDGIAPREQFTISMLTVRAEPPNLLSLRSQESA